MSIKDRIAEAEILWNKGYKEGAWSLVLIAVAATARKRYPQPTPDNEAFKSFVRSYIPTILHGKPSPKGFDAKITFDDKPFEDILYENLRCHLLHEAEISKLVTFSESKIINGKLQATLSVGKPNHLPDFLVLHLIKVIKEVEENSDLFGTVKS